MLELSVVLEEFPCWRASGEAEHDLEAVEMRRKAGETPQQSSGVHVKYVDAQGRDGGLAGEGIQEFERRRLLLVAEIERGEVKGKCGHAWGGRYWRAIEGEGLEVCKELGQKCANSQSSNAPLKLSPHSQFMLTLPFINTSSRTPRTERRIASV